MGSVGRARAWEGGVLQQPRGSGSRQGSPGRTGEGAAPCCCPQGGTLSRRRPAACIWPGPLAEEALSLPLGCWP